VRGKGLVVVAGSLDPDHDKLGPVLTPKPFDHQLQLRQPVRSGGNLDALQDHIAIKGRSEDEPAGLRHIDAHQNHTSRIKAFHQRTESCRSLATDVPRRAFHRPHPPSPPQPTDKS
jgi:hypothetical protein